MRITVWLSDEAPAGMRALARIQYPQGGWAPVVITAPDEEAARAKARAWWDDQLAHHQKKAGPKRAPAAAPVLAEREAI
jgi:hypothetical protein